MHHLDRAPGPRRDLLRLVDRPHTARGEHLEDAVPAADHRPAAESLYIARLIHALPRDAARRSTMPWSTSSATASRASSIGSPPDARTPPSVVSPPMNAIIQRARASSTFERISDRVATTTGMHPSSKLLAAARTAPPLGGNFTGRM